MHKIYMGRAGSGKTNEIYNEIGELCARNRGNVILLVPEQYSHDAERELCKKCGTSASLYAEVLSFTRMAARVFQLEGGAADEYLDEAGRILAISGALEVCSGETVIYNNKLSRRSDFIRKILNTVTEMKAAGITPEDLEITAEMLKKGTLQKKLSDIAKIYSAYEGILDGKRFDSEDRLTKLSEKLDNCDFGKEAVIYIDGFDSFTARQFDIIKKLLHRANSVVLCLNCDGIANGSEIFLESRLTANVFLEACKAELLKVEVVIFDNPMKNRDSQLAAAEQYFAHDMVWKKKNANNNRIHLFKCKSIAEECENAAALCLALVRDNNARWNEIAVACTDEQKYEGLTNCIFEKYGVPLYQNKKTPVTSTMPVSAIIDAVNVITSDWSYESVFSYLKSGASVLTADECDELDNYVFTHNIRGSLWYKNEDWKVLKNGKPANEQYQKRINSLKNKASGPLKKLKAALENASDMGIMIKSLFVFIEETYLFENTVNYAEKLENPTERNLYLRLPNLISDALEQFYLALGSTKADINEFLIKLNLLFSAYSIGTIPQTVDSVSFGDISRMKKRGIKYLVILGLSQGTVPTLSKGTGVFSPYDYEVLRNNNLNIGFNSTEKMYSNLLSFYSTFTGAKEKVYLSYVMTDKEGNILPPVGFYDDFKDMFGMNPVIPESYRYKLMAEKPSVEYALFSDSDMNYKAAVEVYFSAGEQVKTLRDAEDTYGILSDMNISAETAARLYMGKKSISSTGIDDYMQCRYKYFMKYGLQAKPRLREEFNDTTAGNFMHYILQKCVSEYQMRQFKGITDDEIRNLCAESVRTFIADEMGGEDALSPKAFYIMNGELLNNAVELVRYTVDSFAVSDFEPLGFELQFKEPASSGELPAYRITVKGESITVEGRIDRIDGYEKDGKIYIRVVDYKTGNTVFEYRNILGGLNLQMLIYLYAVLENGKEKFGKDVLPAGIIYTPAIIKNYSVSREDKHTQETETIVRTSGIILEDPVIIHAMENDNQYKYIPITNRNGTESNEFKASFDEFEKLKNKIELDLIAMQEDILSGRIKANPLVVGNLSSPEKDSCMYCPYSDVCSYSNSNGAGRRSYEKRINKEEFWKMVDKAVDKCRN